MHLKWITAFVLPWVLIVPARAEGDLSAEEIISRMIARSEEREGQSENRCYICRRVTVIESLNGSGEITERKSKEHRVAYTNGVETARLVKLNDQEPPVRDARGEERREKENREKYARPSEANKRRDAGAIDESLIRRFAYELSGTELVAGRTNHVLKFSPKRETKGGGEVADRVLGLLTGKIWVDAVEYELVRVDAHLSKPFDLLGGLAASINRLDFAIERVRLADGSWANGFLKSEIKGRKLFSSMHSKMNVEQDGFELVAFREDQP